MKYGIEPNTILLTQGKFGMLKVENILSENISFRDSKDKNNYFWYN